MQARGLRLLGHSAAMEAVARNAHPRGSALGDKLEDMERDAARTAAAACRGERLSATSALAVRHDSLCQFVPETHRMSSLSAGIKSTAEWLVADKITI